MIRFAPFLNSLLILGFRDPVPPVMQFRFNTYKKKTKIPDAIRRWKYTINSNEKHSFFYLIGLRFDQNLYRDLMLNNDVFGG